MKERRKSLPIIEKPDEKQPNVNPVDDIENDGYITPIECVGDYSVFVSRIREDNTIPFGLNMWVVSDNLRKGAALNAVQIAETIIKNKLLKN